jgi:Ni/Co efflux regulator RcnB
MSHSEDLFHDFDQPDNDLPPAPDGGYGWVIVGSCFILNAFTWGVTSVSVLGS